MKFLAEIGSEKHEVELMRDEARLFASVDGRKYELEASEPEKGVYLLKDRGTIYEVFVSSQSNPADPSLVRIKDIVREIRILDPKRLRGTKGGDADASGKAEIKTAMPGKVVRILVAIGDAVQKGDGILVVEAMKMQNEMKSPNDGTIVRVNAAEGDTVGAGDVLVVIE